MGFFDTLFSKGPDIKEAISSGGQIVDVRTPGEFSGGNVKGSINIPLNTIQNSIEEFKKMQGPIILCCASGNRSGQATRFLESQGIDCINGGGWQNVNAQI